MTPTPPRRFWQIHLSTAIVMMFVAAGLLYMNTRPQHHVIVFAPSIPSIEHEMEFDYVVYGWPFEATQMFGLPEGILDSDAGVHVNLGFDIGFALVVTTAITFAFEWFQRRRVRP